MTDPNLLLLRRSRWGRVSPCAGRSSWAAGLAAQRGQVQRYWEEVYARGGQGQGQWGQGQWGQGQGGRGQDQ